MSLFYWVFCSIVSAQANILAIVCSLITSISLGGTNMCTRQGWVSIYLHLHNNNVSDISSFLITEHLSSGFSIPIQDESILYISAPTQRSSALYRERISFLENTLIELFSRSADIYLATFQQGVYWACLILCNRIYELEMHRERLN
jgi:hypothetical protein